MHMDNYTFEKCIKQLTVLTEPNIKHPCRNDENNLTIKQIPFSDTYKVIHGDQKIVLDTHVISGMNDISRWINFNWI